VFYLNLVGISLIWGTSVFGGRFFLLRNRKPILLILILVQIAGLAYLSRSQFLLWQEHPISKFLIPPYESLDYFIYYVGIRFWLPYLISLIVALLVLWIALIFNKRKGGRFFQAEEPYLLALAIFMTGHPGWIIYFLLVLFVALLWGAVSNILFKKMERISYYYLWLPAGAATLILGKLLAGSEWYSKLLL
jgi:hypothetical protein